MGTGKLYGLLVADDWYNMRNIRMSKRAVQESNVETACTSANAHTHKIYALLYIHSQSLLNALMLQKV